MAQGEVFVFDQFLSDVHDHAIGFDFGPANSTPLKMALVNATLTPGETDTNPRWGPGGGVDFQVNEVDIFGDYTIRGNALNNLSVGLAGGLSQLDWDNPTDWTAHASHTELAKWGIIYIDSGVFNCLGWVDLGTAFDMTSGTLSVDMGVPALTLNQAP